MKHNSYVFGAISRDSNDDICLPALLREQARVYSERTAVVHEDEHISYRRLVELSTELALGLRHLGVGRDDCVGLFAEPSLDLMVGVWGILFAGAAYLPLSPEYPEERLRYMLDDARVRVVFCQAALATRLAELVPRKVRVVTRAEAAERARGHLAEDAAPSPSDLAYVIYTSGSTGKPKGVMIEHRSIASQMRWLRDAHRIDHERTILQKTPMSFDAAQWELLAAACGSRLVLGEPGVYRDPERLIDTIVKHGVDTLQCVPTLLQALLDAERLSECRSLTRIFSGGEVLSRALAQRCLHALPRCALINLYGPTECTINSSAFTVDRDALRDGPPAVPIGTAVRDTELHILDERQAPVGPAEIGELYIGGVQLARGYLHRPELTAERFVEVACGGERPTRLYRTGDLAHWNADGSVQFVGRTDNQVKLRGYRIELDEIRLPIESHAWVKRAAVIVTDDPRTGAPSLIAFIELDPKEAALMDQGHHGAHHQSKVDKRQVKAQLANLGCRDGDELRGKAAVALPGRVASAEQRRLVFARKTYRYFEGGAITRADLLALLARRPPAATAPRHLEALRLTELGELLRYFGQFLSDERLLPKYGYASPGSLYATQMYLELSQIGDFKPGYYYYHPVHHQLYLIRGLPPAEAPRLRLHFMGKKRAIQPVYQHNIQEVLEIEAGHMVGLLEELLPRYGLGLRDLAYAPATRVPLECATEDYYLGSFEIGPYAPPPELGLDVYVQAHPGRIADLPAGQYQYRDGELARISDELIRKRDVIAINQQVYQRASVGITVVSRPRAEWLAFLDLGRALQRLQLNDLGLGFMSAGYSSKSGHDLPSARRLAAILAANGHAGDGASYFSVGGRVSDEQQRSEGMKEDAVHMKGPAEMIRDDLVAFLPDYMLPNRVVVVDRLPLTANGKVDLKALAALDQARIAERPLVPPRTATERRIGDIWRREMSCERVSVQDDFFEAGGNSLLAVGIVNRLNRELGVALPLQVMFASPTIEALARAVDAAHVAPASRLIRLRHGAARPPIFCWPGLGGFTMNLRLLAGRLDADRPFYGVQARGINPGEAPYPTIGAMAAADIAAIQELQPAGPYTLWGYSFGARVAFETARQLERAGERVDSLFLIAPGSPRVRVGDDPGLAGGPAYTNRTYLAILYSVFAGGIDDAGLRECLQVARDDDSFAAFISARFPSLDAELVKRITRVVALTYQFEYAFHELAGRPIAAPITIFKARGDDYSSVERGSGYAVQPPTVLALAADHYSLLKEAGVDELVGLIRYRQYRDASNHVQKGDDMPHINVKYITAPISEEHQTRLVTALTAAVRDAFGCDEGVISIALEPVERAAWNERVYLPEIVNRRALLRRIPNY